MHCFCTREKLQKVICKMLLKVEKLERCESSGKDAKNYCKKLEIGDARPCKRLQKEFAKCCQKAAKAAKRFAKVHCKKLEKIQKYYLRIPRNVLYKIVICLILCKVLHTNKLCGITLVYYLNFDVIGYDISHEI